MSGESGNSRVDLRFPPFDRTAVSPESNRFNLPMSVHIHPLRVVQAGALAFGSFMTPAAAAQPDPAIDIEVWKQKYSVLDTQIRDQGWWDQDADGDGVSNRNECLAGTNPFRKLPADPHFRPPVITDTPSSLSLAFPTVPGKLYRAESSESLADAWQAGPVPDITGDGTTRTFLVPKSAGKFFRLAVGDQSTPGDGVSDWAKHALGYSPASPIGAQTSYDHTSLAEKLSEQNIVTLSAPDTEATQPPDNAAPASDFALIRVTRSGHLQLGDITVPLAKSGTAVEGVDFVPLPASLTFPAGVNFIDVKIVPLFNPTRTSGATVLLHAGAADTAGASGTFTLGPPSFAGATIAPAANATGTGLTASYFPGSSATYGSPLNFSDQTATTYSYTRTNSTAGTATVTYFGKPAAPFAVGNPVSLQFTSGNLNTAAFNTLKSYVITALPTANSLTVAIAGTALPATGTGNSVIGGFATPVTRVDPLIDVVWGHGTPNGNNYISADNYSVAWDGFLAPGAAGSYVFRLDADDKARVLIDTGDGGGLRQILENGWDSLATGGYKLSAPVDLAIPAAPANRYPIRIEFVETTGNAKLKLQWRVNGGTFATIPAANVFTNNTGTTAGWSGVYFNNPDLSPPAARTQTDSDPTAGNSGDWLTGTPDPLIHHNNFSARWTGQVLPQYSQTYYFVTKANEGCKLWVNQQLVIDKWTGGSGADQTGAIELKAGVPYDITLEYYETTGSAEAHLSWYSADQAKQPIPTSRLFPAATGPPDITSPTHPVVVLGADPPFSMPVTASNGAVVTARGLPPWLTLANGVLSGTPPGPGIYQFELTATNAVGSGSTVVTLEVVATGNLLTRELWTQGVAGPALAHVPWSAPPTSTDTIAIAEDDSGSLAANTGERIRGYFTAPATGNYYFWIAAGNVAELWISNDSEAVNKVLRARVDGPAGSGPRTWNSQPGQKSPWLSLEAGRRYYIEVLHNTGSGGGQLSVAWFLDPTGNSTNPIANGSPPASPLIGGVIPGSVLSPWDNPPTTTIPGALYVTHLQGVEGLGNITATGGAFLRVNGTNAVLQLNHSGLSSGIVSRKVRNAAGQVIFDIDAQDRNHPALRTSDGGYSWNLQPSDVAALNNGEVRLDIATVNNPAGEVTGTFGIAAGSQTPPPVPAYPAWSDLHATSDAANSRFLSQATFGPSPADMVAVKSGGYRAWLEDQLTTPATRNLPYILANLSNDPQNPYGSTLFFNSWWRNSITAPDQLRQRAAFALSQILVVSDTGPLNNNGRTLADYYDTLLDHSFGNFRDILKQVTLSSAMGVYLDMRGNAAGNIQTGVHPNENYAREIVQLFSTGLYRLWPDGTLVLDSTGNAVPTYGQPEVTGLARVFTGWTWGQPMSGGRLPTTFNPASNYLDPMVLVSTRHELGSKVLLDNVVLPPATVVSQSDTSTDPSSTYSVQSTDPALGPGNLVTTTITNRYDLNGVKDLEAALDNIMANSSTGPFICRQLIQRLVTSHPKPEYVHRVTRAFNGERNVDGIATGVRGDMKETLRAILLDYEARSETAAADPRFGKQREPLLRITGPARALPAAAIAGASYRQSGLQQILVTTPAPHRFSNGDPISLVNFTDAGGDPGKRPTAQAYSARNTTPPYSLDGPTGIATLTAPGYQPGDTVAIQFTSGVLGTTAPFNTVRNYTVVAATATNFTVDIGVTSFTGSPAGNAFTPSSFTVDAAALASASYNSTGSTVTITAAGYRSGQQVYLKFSSGGLSGGARDGVYQVNSAVAASFTVTLASAAADTTGSVLIPRLTGGYNITSSGSVSSISLQTGGNHNLSVGDPVQIVFLVTNAGVPAQNGVYTVASVGGPNQFSVTTSSAITNGSQGSNGMVVYPLAPPVWNRSGTVTVDPSTWNVGYSQNDLNQTPLGSATVFNFFYPDYQYPGEIARAGMTTPEFQLTNDSNTMTLTNAVTGSILSAGNGYGFTSFRSGGGAVAMDLGPYMTPTLTNNAGIPALVDTLGARLTGGNLTDAAKATISGYVANTTNFPFSATPTNAQMRDRVRAVVHLIFTSAEFAIQR